MPKITVTVDGSEKENVEFVVLGGKRWGKNGADFGTAQNVASGSSTLSVETSEFKEAKPVTVPDEDSTLKLTVTDNDGDIEVDIDWT